MKLNSEQLRDLAVGAAFLGTAAVEIPMSAGSWSSNA